MNASGSGVARAIEDVRLIDHHCHGIVGTPVDRPTFERLITEGFDEAPPGTSHVDSPVGLAVRRWCAPELDLEPMTSAEVYLERRRELGPEEVSRRMLRAAGLGALLLDTGYGPDEAVAPAEMGRLAGAQSFEIVRLESVAEAVAATDVGAAGYPDAFRHALDERARSAVGLKTIVAYRGGFGFDPEPPDDRAVVRAAGRWLRGPAPRRLEDPTLLRFGIWAGAELARERSMPLQIHAGWGDPDLTLHLANPSLLTELVTRLGRIGVNVIFLHCYPYHREAAYLASVMPNVHFDVGQTITYAGASATGILAEALELAPFTRQLYSSDAFGLPELFLLGAVAFRRGLGRILGRWVEAGDCSQGDAERIVRLIAVGNAERIYPLGGRVDGGTG